MTKALFWEEWHCAEWLLSAQARLGRGGNSASLYLPVPFFLLAPLALSLLCPFHTHLLVQQDSVSSSYVPGSVPGIQGSKESKDLGINPKVWRCNMLLLSTSRRICVLGNLRVKAMLNSKIITSSIETFQILLIIWKDEILWPTKNFPLFFKSTLLSIAA